MAKSKESLHYAICRVACKSLTTLSRWSPIDARRVRGHRDAAGDRTQLTYADGGANALAIQYGYDNLRRVTSITENGSQALAGFAYDSLGRRTAISRGSGGSLASTAYAYDGVDRLSQLSQSFGSSGNNLTLGITRSPSDQLTGKSVSNSTYVHTPAAATLTYNANGLNQYSAVSGTSFGYDGRGNLTSDGARTFTYDLDNHLLTASAPTAVSLAYDPLGRLQTSTAGGTTTNFLYDGDALIAEYDNAGNILRRYVPDPGQDEPLVWYEGAGTSARHWLHADDTGSIIAWSDGTANPQAVYGYGPYGEPGAWSGSRYSYTGQLMIPEAHLYNYKARVYDPGLGRFLQTDPIGYAGDINAYAYAGGDPVNRRDPSGLVGANDTSIAGVDVVVHITAGSGLTASIPTSIAFVGPIVDVYGTTVTAPTDVSGITVTAKRKQRSDDIVTALICHAPAVQGGGAIDAYAGVGGTVSAAVSFNPKNGQISVSVDSGVGVGAGGGARAKGGGAATIANAGDKLPIFGAGLNLNVTGVMLLFGATGSYQLIGSNAGDWSAGATGGAEIGGNVNVSGHVQINLPAFYNMGC